MKGGFILYENYIGFCPRTEIYKILFKECLSLELNLYDVYHDSSIPTVKIKRF